MDVRRSNRIFCNLFKSIRLIPEAIRMAEKIENANALNDTMPFTTMSANIDRTV
jgi:hypothetical protein